ncbi:gluconate 2-dehydrogenase subunit 3 family protein [Marinimicrobium sp. ABcell2]|uniref:gluconate 2-dehydrogenase subunit 3 family protein n=1 Tax=Marinimicrobium sp. ABcell2 TaxID=3069751 RepID=UPI0027B5BDAF|nr:gluconate 2-dehydrogenase subunit 3 family protein [Marinimicrobium sp. ABcell2]MDQ2076857.1 gluconate 2-dehydrogenase subunit 3 family protein [Marinimicrobium sp. ABcell2]
MNRRELLKCIAAATGTAMIGGSTLLAAGCARTETELDKSFTSQDVILLDEVAETIIPRTDTPGAKDAEVGAHMTVMVNNTYTPEEQEIFHRGIPQIDVASQNEFGRDFLQLTPEQRHAVVTKLDREAREYNLNHEDPHYFTMIKQLTLFSFFTSKVGGTEVLRYVAIPGHFDGCMPYEEGDRAWAT